MTTFCLKFDGASSVDQVLCSPPGWLFKVALTGTNESETLSRWPSLTEVLCGKGKGLCVWGGEKCNNN